MGEILKAAGCGYENGKSSSIICQFFHARIQAFYKVCFFFLSLSSLFFAVVKTTVLLADINDFNNVNDVYKQCEYEWRSHGGTIHHIVLSLSVHTTTGFPYNFSSLGYIENLLGIILMYNVLILKVYQSGGLWILKVL